jgi:hypothetical protein
MNQPGAKLSLEKESAIVRARLPLEALLAIRAKAEARLKLMKEAADRYGLDDELPRFVRLHEDAQQRVHERMASVIKQAASNVVSLRRGHGYVKVGFDLQKPDRWRPEVTAAQVKQATLRLFDAVAHDLGTEDPSFEGFVDYASIKLADAGVPFEIAEAVRDWLEQGAPPPLNQRAV